MTSDNKEIQHNNMESIVVSIFVQICWSTLQMLMIMVIMIMKMSMMLMLMVPGFWIENDNTGENLTISLQFTASPPPREGKILKQIQLEHMNQVREIEVSGQFWSKSPSVHHPRHITLSASPSAHDTGHMTLGTSHLVHHPRRITPGASTLSSTSPHDRRHRPV